MTTNSRGQTVEIWKLFCNYSLPHYQIPVLLPGYDLSDTLSKLDTRVPRVTVCQITPRNQPYQRLRKGLALHRGGFQKRLLML